MVQSNVGSSSPDPLTPSNFVRQLLFGVHILASKTLPISFLQGGGELNEE